MSRTIGLFIFIVSSFILTPCQNEQLVNNISAIEPLVLVSEKPIENMPLGNLSGITFCQNKWLVISDKDDKNIYQILEGSSSYQAKKIALPRIPKLNSPFNLSILGEFSLIFRRNYLDFEGMACDDRNNLYIVSEFNEHVLKLSPNLSYASWLDLPANLFNQAKLANLIKYGNAKFEGVALNLAGDNMWLVGERENRGIVYVKKVNDQWSCRKCVLLSEGNLVTSPQALGSQQKPVDFSDIMYFKGKIFTLERLQHQICRRQPQTTQSEKCWSFESILPKKEYQNGDYPFGEAEALWINEHNAWVGIDNNMRSNKYRTRPIIYRFSAPKGGWLQ